MESYSSIKLVETKHVNFKNPVVVIGFPDVGLVGTIAAHYIIEELKLEEIGHIESQSFPPIVIVHNERIQNLMQISGNEDVVVFTSEIPVPLNILDDLVDAITAWIAEKKAQITFIISGVPNQNRLEMKEIGVYAVPTTSKAQEILNKKNLKVFDEGIITGMNALFLRKFFEEKTDSIGLLADTFLSFPDPESSAVIIENLNKVLGWNIDTKKLIEKGEEIRLNARELMKKTKESLSRMHEPKEDTMMYR